MILFITGSTGFLGTGLLHVLQSKNYTDLIYLLIRKKNDKTAIERFHVIQKEFPALQLQLIEKDILQIAELSLPVDCIINCAASIDFCLELQDAMIQNVDGLLELIKFAKRNQVKQFIHISTAYVAEHGKIAKEKFINLKVLGNITDVYAKIKKNDITFADILTKKFFPNTYCFTKCLAEKCIEREIKKKKIIFSIIRPSIITNSESIPSPGWFKGYSAAIGLHKLIHLNVLNILIVNKNTILDYIPVDHVAKQIYNSLDHPETTIKYVTSYFRPSFSDTLLYSSIFNNIKIIYAPNISYYIFKYYNLLKIVAGILYYYLLSCLNKKYISKKNKLIKLFHIVNTIQDNFNHFLHNTYYFNNSYANANIDYYHTMNLYIKKSN
jgi:nucleoside-diphosphate-sugar epimerase